jgi:thiamine pyrophosphokinase
MCILIFANGKLSELDWIKPYLREAEVIIAANGGTRHVLAAGYQPDVVIGDMDSISRADNDQLRDSGVRIIDYPVDKDETDLELALTYAFENYEDDILIIGALGGRLDQTLANILLLADVKFARRRIEIREAHQRAWLVDKSTRIQAQVGDLVSLIPVGGDVQVAGTTGLKWPLQDERLDYGRSRGISNVLIEEVAELTIKSGRLLCVVTDRNWIDG